MIITIIGTGYVGLVSGVCLADSGHDVMCVDIDSEKIDMLNRGKVPIYEPGLDELIERNVKNGRLYFSTDLDQHVKKASVIFIAVGTPTKENGEVDLQYVFNAAESIGKALNDYKVIVDKSTVPVGTAEKVKAIIQKRSNTEFDIVSNPEFLKEGSAIDDFMKPDRIVIGAETKRAIRIMESIYEPFVRTFHPLIVMDTKSAEITKYAANCFLATKISFINEISNLCEKVGADIGNVRKGIGADKRVGYEFLFSGVGYGGSCLPKDVNALIHMGQEREQRMSLIESVKKVNEEQKSVIVQKILKHYKKLDASQNKHIFKDYTFCIWGLSFKPRTDDMREAPSITIINALLNFGANVRVFDPVAINEAKKIFKDKIFYASDQYTALQGADALVLITEWNEFRNHKIDVLKEKMKGRVIFDGRNIYNPETVRNEGFTYYGMGQS